jgi:hypothetical protein
MRPQPWCIAFSNRMIALDCGTVCNGELVIRITEMFVYLNRGVGLRLFFLNLK